MPEIISEKLLNQIIKFRQTLHRYPELSGEEKDTAARIKTFLQQQKPDEIIENIAGHGIAAVFDSGKDGPTLLLRSDLDALPIEEVNDFAHKSRNEGVGHKCGHDGHMAILAGVATLICKIKPKKGRLVLLFQPEEETGQGAEKVINDKAFNRIRPDYAFALHNLPGYEKKAIVYKEGPFAAASKGMIIRLQGASSHAAHPEQGHTPAPMMTKLIDGLMAIAKNKKNFKDFTLLTVIHAKLGEIAFGTTPGKAVVMATLRTYLDEDMEVLTEKAEKLAHELSKEYDIKIEISYTEVFPATNNHTEVTEIIEKASKLSEAKLLSIKEPFRWSEDFGHFTANYKGALFGLGSGKDHPSLHNNDYDFPDEIIKTGIRMFYHITQQILK